MPFTQGLGATGKDGARVIKDTGRRITGIGDEGFVDARPWGGGVSLRHRGDRGYRTVSPDQVNRDKDCQDLGIRHYDPGSTR